jgi:diphosphate-dependent phosphofructokinase
MVIRTDGRFINSLRWERLVLWKELERMEVRNSPFEQEIRKIPLFACDELKDLVPREFAGDSILSPGKSIDIRHKRVAVLFSGGPAAGGHNVLVGLKQILRESTLIGVREGFKGLLAGDMFEIPDVLSIANTGGFDYLGTNRMKIKQQVHEAAEACRKNRIDALVIIGGDDSATNAALLAEHVQTISVPKTMDGDLQYGKLLPIPFGFDTATTIYAEMVGNILQDTRSSLKYWHFIRLMGRTASHVTLEVALQTKPTIALISEEIAEKNTTLAQVVDSIAQVIAMRSKKGMNYGTVLIPEGLLEFIPEVKSLIAEIDGLFGLHSSTFAGLDIPNRKRFVAVNIQNVMLFTSFPGYIQDILVSDRDAHGNLTVSQIETEKLLSELVAKRVHELAQGAPFMVNHHFFGYEGRCGAPTAFDAMLGYNLGLIAGSLVLSGKSGYMASLAGLDRGGSAIAIPLAQMLHEEDREGTKELVVRKALVSLDSPAFRFFASRRDIWAAEDRFSSPGPRQLWGPCANQMPITVALNQEYERIYFR